MRLLRRVPKWMVHDGVIEKSNFRETEGGRGLSVTLWESDADLADVRRGNEEFGVVCVTAADLRELNMSIVRVPLVGNLNHCELFPRLGPAAQKRLKNASAWVHYPEWVSPEHRVEVAG